MRVQGRAMGSCPFPENRVGMRDGVGRNGGFDWRHAVGHWL